MRYLGRMFATGILGFMLLWASPSAFAGWPGDPAAPLIVIDDTGASTTPGIDSDGAGGIVISWTDKRAGKIDVYAQRVDVNGNIKWRSNGVAVASESWTESSRSIAGDGSGGAIVPWMGSNDGYYDILAAGVSASGSVVWERELYDVSYHSGSDPIAAGDGQGGAAVVWFHDGPNSSTSINSLRASGIQGSSVRWTKDICTGSIPNNLSDYQITNDGSTGFIIVWRDQRNSSTSGYDIYAQCVSSSGSFQWGTNGKPVCTAPDMQYSIQVVSDGSGGAFVVWNDRRSDSNNDIYAQHLDASGNRKWGTNGVAICTASGVQVYPQIISDGSGGAFVVWVDERDGNDVYAQHVDANGIAQWATDGVLINAGQYPQIISDGSGGAIITWQGDGGGGSGIGAQSMAPDGSFNWGTDGVLVSTSSGNPRTVSDGSGGAIIVWGIGSGSYGKIYAKRVYSHGSTRLVTAIAPNTGSIYVDTEVTLTGGSLGTTPGTVTFGGQAATIVSWSDTEVVCVAPLGAPGAVDVVLTRADGLDYTEPEGFTYIGTTIRSVFADTGSIHGGTVVTIGGVSFDTAQGTGSVTFGGEAATVVSWSDGEVVCLTPAHAPGAVDVVLTSDAGDSSTASDGFTYIGLAVFCLTPSEGRVPGGTQVTIDGIEFGSSQGSGSVTFGGQAATVVSWSDTRIVCTTPPHASGTVDVVVTNDSGDSDAASFIYLKMVTSISPDTGPAAGGTPVTVGGIGFGSTQGTGGVTFDGEAATITSWSDTQIVCSTPPHAAGMVDVVVTNGDGASDRSTFAYTGETPEGTQRWRFLTGGDSYQSSAIGPDGTIYVPQYGGQYYLYALNPDGSQKWKSAMGGSLYTPSIGADGTIYIGASTSLYALNPDSSQKWVFVASSSVYGAPAIGVDGTIYVHALSHVHALNPDGTEKWQIDPPGGYIDAVAIGTDGTIYVASRDYYLTAFNPDGTQKWVFTTEDDPKHIAIGGDGIIYIGSSDYNLYALNPDGTQRWAFTTGSSVKGVAIGTDDTIYAASSDKNVYALNPDGTEQWKYTTTGNLYHVTIGADGTIYTGEYGGNHRLLALNPNGTLKWAYATGTGGNIYTSPIIGLDGTVYFGSHDDYFYAVACSSFGLADSPWPTYGHDARRTASAEDPYRTRITCLDPTQGPPLGGTEVVIGGIGFGAAQGNGGVTFGGLAATIVSWSDREIICQTPAHPEGIVPLVVKTSAGYYDTTLFVYSAEGIASVTPQQGLVSGGTQVTIDGFNFGDAQGSGSVTFGGTLATITSWANDEIVCTTPAHDAGTVDVVVTNDEGDVYTKEAAFSYVGQPGITSIFPGGGLIAGGTPVIIEGTNFGSSHEPSGGVTFDGLAATITSWTNTLIECVNPAHAEGWVDVAVTEGFGLFSATETNGFYYIDIEPPDITAVSPTGGTTVGGTTVTVTGSNFGAEQGSGGVYFDRIASTVTSWSDTEIVCLTPAHAEGLVDVAVMEPNGYVTDTLTDGYLYILPPQVTSVSPAGGTTLGGNTVTLTGTAFGDQQGASGSVVFGGVEAASITSWSDTQIVCVTAPRAEELVDVVVTEQNGILSGTKTEGFRYVEPPEITSVTLIGGTTAGGSSITVGGTNFGTEQGVGTLIFGGTEVTAYTSWSDTEIVCVTPVHEEGWVDVEVTEMYGFVSDTEQDGFVFINPPVVDAIDPKPIVTVKGGTQVTVTGLEFGAAEDDKLAFAGQITFGGAAATIVSWEETQIVCTTPALTQGGLVDVEVTERYGFLSDDEVDGYLYLAPVEVLLSDEERVRWRIVGPPVMPPAPDGDSLFDNWGKLLVDWTVARWDQADYRYERPNGLSQGGVGKGLEMHEVQVLPGTGWWIAKTDSDGFGVEESTLPGRCTWEVIDHPIFTTIDGSITHATPLKPGWNMIANPFPFNRAWNNDGVTLSYTKGGQTVTDQPIGQASACTDGKLYWYDANAATYPPGIRTDVGHIMGPWYGYFLKVEDDVTDASLNITGKLTKDAADIYPAATNSVVAIDWQMSITAWSGTDESSRPILAGICQAAQPEADALDDRLPLESPDGEPLRLHFDHSEWPVWNGAYRQDLRPEARLLVYPIHLEVPTSGQAVTLSFRFESVPEGYATWLLDAATGDLTRFPQPLPTIHQLSFWPLTPSLDFEMVVTNLATGDIDADGQVTSADVSEILRCSVAPESVRSSELVLGDVTQNSAVTAYDAAKLVNDITPVLTTQQVNVSIPSDLSASPGATGVEMPIHVSDVTGLDILGADLVLAYDSSLLTATGATLEGGIAASGQVEWRVDDTNGRIQLGLISGSSALSGEGILVSVLFDVASSVSEDTTSSALSLTQVSFNEGGVACILEDGLLTLQLLKVTGISPSRGPASGGTPVTLTGQHFVDGMAVTIGGESATDVTVVSSTEVTALIPHSALPTPHSVDVVASNGLPPDTPGYQSSTLSDGFSYVSDEVLAHRVLVAGQAYHLSFFDDTLTLTIPAGAIPTSGTLEVETLVNTSPLLGGLHDLSLNYAFRFLGGSTELALPITLAYYYQEEMLPSGVPEDSLQVYREKGGLWLFAGGVVDVQEDTVTAAIDRFSTYGLLAGYAYGEVSGNGSISSFDSALVLQKSVGLIGALPPPDRPAFRLQTGDVSGNGAISSFDSSLILRKSVGLPPHPSYPDRYTFPVEEPPQVAAPAAESREVLVDARKVGDEMHIDLLLAPASIGSGDGIYALDFACSGGSAFRFVSAETPPLSMQADQKVHETAASLYIGFADVTEIETMAGTNPGEQSLLTVRMRASSVGATGRSPLKGILDTIQLQLNEGQIPVTLTILPQETKLLPNYPNPFNPETWLPYTLTESGAVSIDIHNVSGQLVRRLELGQKARGSYVNRDKAAYWDGRNDRGERVSSGVYFYTLRAGNFTTTRKMVTLK